MTHRTEHCECFLPSLGVGTCLPVVEPPGTHSLPAVCCAAYTPVLPGSRLWRPFHWPTHITWSPFSHHHDTQALLLIHPLFLHGPRVPQQLFTSRMRSPDCRRPSLTAAPRGRMFLTRMGPGPWSVESLVTTVKPRPSDPTQRWDATARSHFSPKYPVLLCIWCHTHTHTFENTRELWIGVVDSAPHCDYCMSGLKPLSYNWGCRICRCEGFKNGFRYRAARKNKSGAKTRKKRDVGLIVTQQNRRADVVEKEVKGSNDNQRETRGHKRAGKHS